MNDKTPAPGSSSGSTPGSNRSLLDQYTKAADRATGADGDVAPANENEAVKEFACYAEQPVSLSMVDFRTNDGKHKVLPYFHLEMIDYDPSTGIELLFAKYKVNLRGQHLEPLLKGLTRHRVGYVKVAPRMEFKSSVTSSETLVKEIHLTPRPE